MQHTGAGLAEPEIVDPGYFRIKPQHLTQRQRDPDQFDEDNQSVQAGIGHEGDDDLLTQKAADYSNQDDKDEHPDQENVRRR